MVHLYKLDEIQENIYNKMVLFFGGTKQVSVMVYILKSPLLRADLT